MSTSNRRTFMMQIAVGSTALACGRAAQAVSKKIEENEAKATSLGYRHDSTQVDAKRFPKHTPAEKCSGCMAWLGKPADAWAECDLMADRLVSSTGWCSSYVKLK
jgi:High potential iron-sulfur protein